MSVIFKLDGTVTYENDVIDEQQDLKDTLQNFEDNIRDHFQDLRGTRNLELVKSDWTQGADSPLDSSKQDEWKNYRTKLRDLPNHAKAPIWFEESDIPLPPGESSIPEWAEGFIKSRIDPIGIGTTSWVGITTGMVKKGSMTGCGAGIGTDIVGVADTSGVEVGDTLKTEGVIVSTVAGITTTSVSLASTTPVSFNGDLDYFREGNVYFAQSKPCNQISYDLSSKVEGISTAKAVIGTNNGFDFVVTITNMISEAEYDYSIKTNPERSYIDRTGTIGITPDSNCIGIATFPVSISGAAGTITSITDITFNFDVDGNHQEQYVVGIATTSVGVGTT